MSGATAKAPEEDRPRNPFFDLAAPLDPVRVDPVPTDHDPSELLRHLGPPPPWSVPAQLRGVLEPAYHAAAELARDLLGRWPRKR